MKLEDSEVELNFVEGRMPYPPFACVIHVHKL